MPPPPIIVKVTYNSELKRISFVNAQAFTYSKLHAEFTRMFSLAEPYKVYYVDDDMDEVTVTSDQDLAEALSMFQSQQSRSNKGVTCRFSIKQIGNKGEDKPSEKAKGTAEQTGPNAWAGLAQNFVDHLERQMSFMQDSAQSSASALAAAANAAASSATQNWQRAFNANAQSQGTAGNASTAQSSSANTKTPTPNPTNNGAGVHNNVMCDHCYRAVQGTRWKCQDCRDYDLCDGCKTAGQYTHPTHHRFRSMQPSAPFTQRRHQRCRSRGPFRPHMRNMPLPVVSCDFCDSVITGDRYKCQDCPDFDLCDRCIVLADSQHPGHSLELTPNAWHGPGIFQRQPTVKEEGTNYHAGVRCDGCDKWIYGVRYKCGNCADFDYCGKCEGTLEHIPNHIFLKIKKPVTGPVPTSVSLLPNLYAPEQAPKVYNPPQGPPPQMQQKDRPQSASTAFGMFPSAGSSSRTVDQQSVSELESKLERLSTKSGVSIVSSSNVEKPSGPSPSASVMTNSQPDLFARFVDDVNIPDGTVVAAKSRFLKIWNMVNEGTQEWPQGTQLSFCGGDTLAPHPYTTTFAVPVTKPGKNAYVTADLQAPAKPGRYVSYFRLVTPSGTRFGHRVWCDIFVENEEQQGSSTSSSVMIYPTLTNREGDDEDKATIRTEEGSSHLAQSAFASSVATPSVRSVSDTEDNDSEDAYSGYEVYAEPEVPGTPDEAKEYIVIEQDEDADSYHDIRSVSSPDNGAQRSNNPFLTEKEQEDELNSSSKIEESPQETPAPESTVDPALAAELDQLHDMGFYHDAMNVGLLEAFDHKLEDVVMELLRLQK